MKNIGKMFSSGRRSPSKPPPPPTDEKGMIAIQRENEALKAELAHIRECAPEGRDRATTVGEVEIDATPAEIDVMRQAFDTFDEHSTGAVPVVCLRELHAKLGEPIGDAEMAELGALLKVDEATEGATVTFEQFMQWWNVDHTGDLKPSPTGAASTHHRGRRYSTKFKIDPPTAGARGDAPPVAAAITTRKVGFFPSHEYRVFFETTNAAGETVTVSPWHNVPLKNGDGTYNFICEIPKWTRAKMEIATGEPHNPIKQDTKNGKLRDYQWGDMMFNYGALPQTWEDPAHVTVETAAPGDNDPIDAVEIGARQRECGSITKVKVLGVLAMIDDGETDWKLITLAADDDKFDSINTLDDLEAWMPNAISSLREWLRVYKICTGKPANTFGFDGECQDAAYAAKIIDETHGFWKKMVRTRRASVGGMAARPPPAGPPSHLIAHLVADRDLLTGRAPAVAP